MHPNTIIDLRSYLTHCVDFYFDSDDSSTKTLKKHQRLLGIYKKNLSIDELANWIDADSELYNLLANPISTFTPNKCTQYNLTVNDNTSLRIFLLFMLFQHTLDFFIGYCNGHRYRKYHYQPRLKKIFLQLTQSLHSEYNHHDATMFKTIDTFKLFIKHQFKFTDCYLFTIAPVFIYLISVISSIGYEVVRFSYELLHLDRNKQHLYDFIQEYVQKARDERWSVAIIDSCHQYTTWGILFFISLFILGYNIQQQYHTNCARAIAHNKQVAAMRVNVKKTFITAEYQTLLEGIMPKVEQYLVFLNS